MRTWSTCGPNWWNEMVFEMVVKTRVIFTPARVGIVSDPLAQGGPWGERGGENREVWFFVAILGVLLCALPRPIETGRSLAWSYVSGITILMMLNLPFASTCTVITSYLYWCTYDYRYWYLSFFHVWNRTSVLIQTVFQCSYRQYLVKYGGGYFYTHTYEI